MVNEGRCEEFVYQGQIPLVQDLFNYRGTRALFSADIGASPAA